jgi:glycogen operon protein
VDESFLLLFNAGQEHVVYRLPPRRFGSRWKLELATAEPDLPEGEGPSYPARTEIEVAPLSLVLLRRAW